tara:strand:+ start:86 stop:2443 length:2358 start_codon:yes stop_codon:yes gene_type:complete
MEQFAGFTNAQFRTILGKLGYESNSFDTDEVNKYLAANPNASAKLGQYTMIARQMVSNKNNPRRGFAPGGLAEMNKYISGSGGNYKDLSTFENYDFSQAPFSKEEWMAQAKAEGGGSNTQQSTDMNVKFGATAPGATTFTPDPVTTSANNQVTTQGNIQPGGVQNTNTGATSENWQDDPNFNWNTLNVQDVLDLTVGNIQSTPELIKKFDANNDGKVNATDVSIIQNKQKASGTNTTFTQPNDPTMTMTNVPVNLMQEQPGQTLDPTTGQIGSGVPQVNTTTVDQTVTADQQTQPDTSIVEPSQISDQTEQNLQNLNAEQGTVSPEGTVQPAQQDTLQQTDLEAAQLDGSQTVQPTTPRQVEQGEMIPGSSVDMSKVESAIGKNVAQQAVPSAAATVQGQLEQLTADFDAASPPAWAAGAMRKALASMASRGLGASSLAGQSLIQAAMESAIPIAQADARTVASFEAQNLSNRQQTAMLAAEQRADFLKIDFNQDFQAKVANAAKISDIANMNFTAEQQIALENARMAQTVDLANLNNRQAKIMADAAALTQLDLSNLNNRQQAQVQNAKAFLQMDLANLDNAQQTAMFKAQARQQSLLSDQASENAARQFNASSQNQSDQFFAKLNSDVAQFNSAQQNGMAQFNAGQTNSLSRFNAELQEQRAQFNASNGLIVAQANTQWRQFLSTTNTAAINAANMQDAKMANDMTQSQMDNYWQEKRDLMSFIWKSGENEKNRIADLYMSENGATNAQEYADNVSKGQLIVTLASSIFGDGDLSFLNPINWF